MEKIKNNPEKLCSFYVSELHLATMILPYINKKINEKAKIITFLENNIEENIKMLISKLNLKNEKKILNLNWKQNQNINEENISEKLKDLKEGQNIILINGKKEYIENMNKKIEEIMKKISNEIKNKKIKIINCYEVIEFNGDIKEILDMHDKVLNTSGEKNIEEVFEGYIGKRAV